VRARTTATPNQVIHLASFPNAGPAGDVLAPSLGFGPNQVRFVNLVHEFRPATPSEELLNLEVVSECDFWRAAARPFARLAPTATSGVRHAHGTVKDHPQAEPGARREPGRRLGLRQRDSGAMSGVRHAHETVKDHPQAEPGPRRHARCRRSRPGRADRILRRLPGSKSEPGSAVRRETFADAGARDGVPTTATIIDPAANVINVTVAKNIDSKAPPGLR
jgi:hypothetical protein